MLVLSFNLVSLDLFANFYTTWKTPKILYNLIFRFAAASVVLNNNLLWVVGGHDGFSELSTSEFITLDQLPKPGPNLPFSISWHSMIQYDSNSIYIIGGKQDCTNSKKTWIVNVNDLNIKNFKIQEGSMHKLRYVENNWPPSV